MELPTREQAGHLAGSTRKDSRLGPISWPVIDAYADGTLMTWREFIDTLRDRPILDMGDDNHWVMINLGPYDDDGGAA